MVSRWSGTQVLLFVCALTLSGCAGRQSALEPAAREAHLIAQLWWWMLSGGVAVWLAMMALSYYAIFAPRRPYSRRATAWVVIGGGVVFRLCC